MPWSALGTTSRSKSLPALIERVDHLHRRCRIDVVVHLADDQEQLAVQLRRRWPRWTAPRSAGRPASPSTARSTRSCPCGCRGSRTPTRRPCRTPDGTAAPAARSARRPTCRRCRRASRSIVRILRRGRLDPQDAVGEPGVAEVLPANVVERLRAVRRAHAVDLHHDEPQLRQRSADCSTTKIASGRTNPAARRRCLRSPDTSSLGSKFVGR